MAFPFNLLTNLLPNTVVIPDNRDLLNVNNDNTIQNARYINPQTADYEQSADNHLVGENAVDQQVLMILNTSFNTAFVQSFGQNFRSIKMINSGTVAQAATLLSQSLSVLLNNGSITLQNVSITTDAFGQVNINFSYTNNTLGIQKSINFLPHS